MFVAGMTGTYKKVREVFWEGAKGALKLLGHSGACVSGFCLGVLLR